MCAAGGGEVLQGFQNGEQAVNGEIAATVNPEICLDGAFETDLLQGRAAGEGRVHLRAHVAKIHPAANAHQALAAMEHLTDGCGVVCIQVVDDAQIAAAIEGIHAVCGIAQITLVHFLQGRTPVAHAVGRCEVPGLDEPRKLRHLCIPFEELVSAPDTLDETLP